MSAQYFYTSDLVNGTKVTEEGLNSTCYLALAWSTSKKGDRFVGKVDKYEDGKRKSSSWNSVTEKLVENLHEFDPQNGGLVIVCKDSKELAALMAGKIQELHYAGDHDDTDVQKQVKIK